MVEKPKKTEQTIGTTPPAKNRSKLYGLPPALREAAKAKVAATTSRLERIASALAK
ncbi:MAG: hypothetical protein JNK05_10680 [Myxococcales bacterium]|nr:hypothetical protein [Myxococcales bacterium]